MTSIVQLIVLLNGLLGQLEISQVDQLTDFGLNLLKSHNDLNPTKNIMISPPSVAIALAMLSHGSQGDTKDQLTSLFPFLSEIKASRSNEIKDLLNKEMENAKQFNLTGESSKVWLINRLLVDSSLNMNPKYVQTLKNDFESDVITSSPGEWTEKLKEVNDWAKENTNEFISEVIPSDFEYKPNNVNIMNGLAFNGFWERSFEKKNTRRNEFENLSGSKSVIDFMKDKSKYPFAFFKTHKVISLAYQEPASLKPKSKYRRRFKSSLHMLIFLPNQGVSLNSIIEMITDREELKEQMSRMYEEEIDVLMPKFNISNSFDIRDTLKNMSLTAPFERSSDFTPMCAEVPGSKINTCSFLEIDEMVHAVSLAIDEEGTKAAATTRISMSTRGGFSSALEFHIKRPFAFVLLIDQVPLFVGAIRELK